MKKQVLEEGVSIFSFGDKISRELNVFYNPIMKLNRDISLLVLYTYFTKYHKKKLKFCDPMGASGIRELRFVKTIPNIFEKIVIGDISGEAIENIKNNFSANKLSLENVELIRAEAINTIAKEYYDFIEIDPFGSPIEFLDIAIQRIKHKGIISITATDTAALCGTYPKTTLRRYNIDVIKTLCYDEIGLRNLIANAQVFGARYDKELIPIFSYTSDHYYKVFFKILEGRERAFRVIKNQKYIKWDNKTQDIKINDFGCEKCIGKTYVGNLIDREFSLSLKENLNLIEDNKKVTKLIENLLNEGDEVGYKILAKLQKEFKIPTCPKFEIIEKKLKELEFTYSRPHNNRFGIKTNCTGEKLVEIIKEN